MFVVGYAYVYLVATALTCHVYVRNMNSSSRRDLKSRLHSEQINTSFAEVLDITADDVFFFCSFFFSLSGEKHDDTGHGSRQRMLSRFHASM